MNRKHPEKFNNSKRWKLKDQNFFFLGILISTIIGIAMIIWSNSLLKLFDMLPYTEPARTYITVFGGFIVISYLLWFLWKFATKKY